MEIRIRATGAVVSEQEFRNLHSGISLPALLAADILNDLGADPVLEGPQATGGNQYQISVRDGVEQVDGVWLTKYVLGPTFDSPEAEAEYKAQKDAEQAEAARISRNALLAASDWTQARDVVLPNDAEWAAYRQALRDISSQPGFPWTVEWPVQPV